MSSTTDPTQFTSAGSVSSTVTSLSSVTSTPNESYVVSENDTIQHAFIATLNGLEAGSALVFLYSAVQMYWRKRTWLTLINVLQLSCYLTHKFTVGTYAVVPAHYVNCEPRIYVGSSFFSLMIAFVWALNFLKFQVMYREKPILKYGVLLICFASVAALFPWLQSVKSWGPGFNGSNPFKQCKVSFSGTLQAVQSGADVFVKVVLSSLFIIAIYKHISASRARQWDSHSKLSYILTCDVRAAFVDTMAQIVKLIINLLVLDIVPPQYRIGADTSVWASHIVDWIKPAAAHWFVRDIVRAAEDEWRQSNRSGGSPGIRLKLRRDRGATYPDGETKVSLTPSQQTPAITPLQPPMSPQNPNYNSISVISGSNGSAAPFAQNAPVWRQQQLQQPPNNASSNSFEWFQPSALWFGGQGALSARQVGNGFISSQFGESGGFISSQNGGLESSQSQSGISNNAQSIPQNQSTRIQRNTSRY